ncbi:hypothetical protein A5672_08960 [Mycobacterium alsense]|uniref:SWIM-type domain-containing protein n=1 Tax=Mycobacterium alsense TaxID=324058 RepID=A0ABD6P7H5_9MYCO|nr:hypothetical protein A5672_08960 [Mycobacterium alsense]
MELDWSGPQLDGYCTCPYAGDGHFCKHPVAVGLAVIDSGAVDDTTEVASALQATVQAMDVDELRELVMTLAHRDGEVRRMLEVRATAASGDDTTAKAEFEAYVRNAVEFRGFVDYRESYAVAQAASQVLDELERHLNAGSAEIVRPALLCALTVLRTITEQTDDSSGVIGAECQHAADLYAQACRLSRPDPVELARWLVTSGPPRRVGRHWCSQISSTRSTTEPSRFTALQSRTWTASTQVATIGAGLKSTPCCWSSPITTATSIELLRC